MATLQESAQSILNEKNLKVLPENIVKGITMFGVEGTAEISVSADTLLWNIIPQGYGTTSITEPTVGDVVTYYDYTGSYAENNHTIMERYNYNTEIEAEKPRVNDLVIGRSPMNYDQPGKNNAYLPYYILGQITSIAPQSWEPEIIEYKVKILGYYQGYLSIEELAANSTADASDIVMDKIAYTKNGQISGTLVPQEYVGLMDGTEGYWSYEFEGEHFKPSARMNSRTLIENGAQVEFYLPQNEVAAAAGITGDKVVSGYSILGVEGTAEMGGTSGLTVITSLGELATLTDTSKKVALISPEKLEKIIDKMGPSIFIRKEFTMEEALPNGYKFAYFYTASGEWNMSSWGSYIDLELRDNNTGDTLKSYHWNRQADGLTYVRSGSDEIVFLGGSYNAGSSSYPEILRITSTAFANYSAADNKIYEHNGTEWILAEGQIDTTDATAQVRDIAKGKTAYINGKKVTGSVNIGDDYLRLDVREIWQNGDLTHIFFDQDRFESDVLYRNGTHIESNLPTSQVASDLGITADKIVKGQTILDVEGTVDIGGGVDTSDATATAADILEGVDAYIQGEKVTGTMVNLSGKSISGAMNDIVVSNNNVQMTILPGNFGYVDDLTHVNVSMGEVELANELGIDANKIMKGETVLGIEGTREAGAGDTPIIASTDELATITDTTTKVILVAPEKIETVTSTVGPHILVKKQFTLDTAITSSTWGYSNLSSGEQLYLEINASQMKLSTDSFSYTWYVQSDGVTYSRNGEDEVVYLKGTGNMNSFYGNSKKAFNASVFNYSAETTVIYEHNGSDWVPMKGQTDTSDATAKASDMLWGKTAYVNGKKVTGTINGATSMTYNSYPKIYGGRIQMAASVSNYYFYSGATLTCETTFANMASVIGLTAAKIKKGETILGIEGTYEGEISEA